LPKIARFQLVCRTSAGSPIRARTPGDHRTRLAPALADAIRSQIRKDDLIGRLPGCFDFALLIYGADTHDLDRIGERIRRAVKSIERTVAAPSKRTLSIPSPSRSAAPDSPTRQPHSTS